MESPETLHHRLKAPRPWREGVLQSLTGITDDKEDLRVLMELFERMREDAAMYIIASIDQGTTQQGHVHSLGDRMAQASTTYGISMAKMFAVKAAQRINEV